MRRESRGKVGQRGGENECRMYVAKLGNRVDIYAYPDLLSVSVACILLFLSSSGRSLRWPII